LKNGRCRKLQVQKDYGISASADIFHIYTIKTDFKFPKISAVILTSTSTYSGDCVDENLAKCFDGRRQNWKVYTKIVHDTPQLTDGASTHWASTLLQQNSVDRPDAGCTTQRLAAAALPTATVTPTPEVVDGAFQPTRDACGHSLTDHGSDGLTLSTVIGHIGRNQAESLLRQSVYIKRWPPVRQFSISWPLASILLD